MHEIILFVGVLCDNFVNLFDARSGKFTSGMLIMVYQFILFGCLFLDALPNIFN